MEKKFDYTNQDISNALRRVGIKTGDNIFVHSNMGFFGRLKDAKTEKEYYAIFKKAIFEVIGYEGTLIVPTFSYSFCWNNSFDRLKTPGVCGFLSEQVRLDPEAERSGDANFSIAAIGKNALFFTKSSPKHSFGPDSFWDRFFQKEGIICNFNFDAGSTFIHFVERSLNVSYRFDKKFEGLSIENGIPEQKEFFHFVYDLEKPEDEPDFTRFDEISKQRMIAKTADIGKGQIVAISSRDTFTLIEELLRNNPRILRKR
jgi:aminoglycoside 3-N-acetyltransferase